MASSLIGQFGIACLFLLAVFAIRLPSRLSRGFLWGEDTEIFMRAAYETGVNSLLAPYADYLHTLPRLLAYALAHTTAITSTPYTYVYACLLLYAASASYLYRVALRFFDGCRFAAAIAAAPFLVAQSGEVYLSVTNLQWIAAVVLLAMVWDTFTPCTPRRAWSLRLAILAVLIMTEPFAVFFSAVFVLILWHNPASPEQSTGAVRAGGLHCRRPDPVAHDGVLPYGRGARPCRAWLGRIQIRLPVHA